MQNDLQIDEYPAGEDCLIILTGLGGDTRGYNDKYVKIAGNTVEKHNFTVYVAGVPSYCWEKPKAVFDGVMQYVLSRSAPEKDNVEKLVFPQADHLFSGKTEEFISLAETLFEK